MLDFNLRPKTSTSIPTMTTLPVQSGSFFADVRARCARRTDLSDKTRARYLSALDRMAEIRNLPLGTIPADLAVFDTRFPRNGFDPVNWSSDTAYRT